MNAIGQFLIASSVDFARSTLMPNLLSCSPSPVRIAVWTCCRCRA